jgi:hypothetical protein
MGRISVILFILNFVLQIQQAGAHVGIVSHSEDSDTSSTQSLQNSNAEANPLHRLQNAILSVTINDNISPVVASRIFVYPNIAFLNGISELKKIPVDLRVNAGFIQPSSLTATYAFVFVAQSMIYTRNIFDDSVRNILNWYDHFNFSETQKNIAEQDARKIANAVIEKMKMDGFRETRSMAKYQEIHDEHSWRPTAPGYFQAVEPNWGKVKPLVVKDLKFPMVQSVVYDTSRNSQLYKEALEVYQLSKKGSEDHKTIAGFWDCNPFALHVYGHRMEAEKKMSPVGHWICIAQKIIRQKNLDIVSASKVYATLSTGIFDALIYCWEMKYRFKFIRPEHFITTYIDPEWQPLLQSPPFPEFPSGHSVISATAAVILTNEFGTIKYEDDTELNFGIQPRKFNSFFEAADEAAMSRVYGGIHFRHAATEGKKIGLQIGEHFLKRLNL